MRFCPACGRAVSDIMEAHRVDLVSTGKRGPRTKAPRTSPAHWCVAWPCGCTLAPSFARALSRVGE